MVQQGGNDGARTALYRKYRGKSLDEIVSQPQVTEVLRRSLAQGRIAHAYLLTGPKGTGKTSVARILAHEINRLPYNGEETHLDIIEIDAASNNGVEDVRDLRDKVQLAPISASKKVYIIDEVHMLSKPAFNALLKTLEEPPAHVVFILATTDLHKVPATIISRTQHFSFRSISRADLAGQLKKIAEAEGIKISADALDAIAARGDGSFRNSISLLDQLSGFADDKEGITLDLVESTLGLASSEAVGTLLSAVAGHDVATVISTLDQLEQQGIQPTVLADQLLSALRTGLTEHPSADWRIGLLDALLTVSTSPQPQLKLLTTLVSAIKPKTAAALSPKKKPSPTVIEAPVVVIEKPAKLAPAAKEPTVTSKPPTSTVHRPPSTLDWQQLLDRTKKDFVALHSVLRKCDYELHDDTLTIYTVTKFYKTKLDEQRYHAQLSEVLARIGQPDLTIKTVPAVKPPEDERLAKVAALMGGGQVIPLDEEAA